MTTPVGKTEIAFWYHQVGVHESAWSTFDRVWAVADPLGAPLGTVEFDTHITAGPTYRLRDIAGTPVIAVAPPSGLTLSNEAPLSILWPDGSTVGTFGSPEVWWGQQPIGKWLVQLDLDGRVGYFGGAWLWDTHDTVVASVTQVKDPATGSHLVLSRAEGLDDLLGWATLAFPLAVHQRLYEREVQDTRGSRRNDTTKLL